MRSATVGQGDARRHPGLRSIRDRVVRKLGDRPATAPTKGSEAGGRRPSPASWNPRRIVASAALVAVVLLSVLGYVLATSQVTSRHEARARFAAQAASAAGLSRAIFAATVGPATATASQALGGPRVQPRALATLARTFGYVSVSVIGGKGHVLAATPQGLGTGSGTPEQVRIAIQHAVNGQPWFSNLFVGPDHGYAVAETLPFPTRFGRRVEVVIVPVAELYRFVSGYLAESFGNRSTHGFIFDGNGRFVGSSVAAAKAGQSPKVLRTILASRSGIGGTVQGTYDIPSGPYRGERFVATAPIVGTTWRVAITEPTSMLYPAAVGSQRWIMWAVFLAGALAALACLFFLRLSLTRATQLVSGARRVEQVNDALTTTNDELKAFSYSVSHDLRAPLRAIDGFTRIVIADDQGTLTAEQRRCLGVVRTSTRTMSTLIDDLLSYSRLVAQPLNRQTVGTAELVAGVERDLRGSEGNRVVFVNGALPAVEADLPMLRQLFSNLIQNAVKYSSGDMAPRVEVDSENATGELVFRVHDNGVGFDMRYADKLFEPFQRLHRAEDYEGTGVGLAIVKRIVARHGGRVWADGQVNGGATFYFTLDARKAS